MSKSDIRKLPPMTALEFAIEQTFRNFFFGIRLVLGWAVVLSPLLIAAYLMAFRNGMPDVNALPPATLGIFAAIAVAALLASFSIAVNWHRRILLDETPRRLLWMRLDGVVWRYMFGLLVILAVLGLVAAAAIAAMTYLPPMLEPQLGPAAANAGKAAAAVLGLIGMFIWYRLSTWLPAIATRNKAYGLRAAWKVTRRNSMRYLGFTFWLLFGLATAGAIAAGAYFAQRALGNPWATAIAFMAIGYLAWLSLFLLMTIATSHFRCFNASTDTAELDAVSPA